ncbi:MAG: C10 family peptidase [Bacteroidota bacterium]
MKTKLFFLVIFFCLFGFIAAKAEQIDTLTAKKVAKTFYTGQFPSKIVAENDFSIIYTYSAPSTDLNIEGPLQNVPLIYVVSLINAGGYVFVSGDNNVEPVLGYSEDGFFSETNHSPSFIKWMSGYCQQIQYIIINNEMADNDIELKWKAYSEGNNTIPKGTKAVNPLLQTTWDQSPYYNALCPGGSVTGCVATAMAQILKYWDWPIQGAGNHCYTENNYGQLCADFGSTNYDWANMPNNVTSANTAVATLMFHCGVSVDMDYSPSASSAQTSNVVNALETYFQYASSAQYVTKSSYTNANWIALLKVELDAGRPMQYRGSGSNGGHSFVCDGYDNSNYFHFNWGWSGSDNGFFILTSLSTSNGSFTNDQGAIIGIQPSYPPSYDIGLYSAISVTPTSITSNQAFDVSADIANYGTANFTGDFSAAIFDDQGTFIDFINTYTNYTLNAGYFNSFTFSSTGMALPTGNYYIGIYYADNSGAWMLADENSYTNPILVSVAGATNDIALADNILQSPSTLIQNQPATFTTDIANYGVSTFTGWLSADVYTTDDVWVKTIYEYSGCNLPSGYMYDNKAFTTSSLNVPPGLYKLYILMSYDYSSWYIVGGQYYSNPIYIEVLPAPLSPDIYENNNTVTVSYNLTLSYSGNSAHKTTAGSNMHNSTDQDYYKIVLPTGYNYTISARVHDSYNSGNGQTYTNDVLFTYRINSGAWSTTYDDIMPNTISTGPATVYFHVSPYFTGTTGTYLLDLTVTRTSTSDIEEHSVQNEQVSIYPNPAQNTINIFLKSFETSEQHVSIVNTIGQIVYSETWVVNSDLIKPIDVGNLSNGLYIFTIDDGKALLKKPFVVKH